LLKLSTEFVFQFVLLLRIHLLTQQLEDVSQVVQRGILLILEIELVSKIVLIYLLIHLLYLKHVLLTVLLIILLIH